MPRNEPSPSGALNRLNAYLDELTTRGVADWEGLEPSLAATVDYVHALDDRAIPAPGLMEETWRTLMGTTGVAQHRPDVIGTSTGAPRTWTTRQMPTDQSAARPRWFGGGLAAAILLIAVVVGYATYSITPSGDDERPIMPAAVQDAATAEASPGPALAGCTAEPRPDGSVVALAGTQPTVMRILPRLNEDPFHFEQRSAPVDGELLFYERRRASEDTVDAINATLAELAACRYYQLDANGRPNLDGRYYALYSDDFFRGELAGYREAGLEPTIISGWSPSRKTTVADARVLEDGRVVARLTTGTERYHSGWRWVAIFTRMGDRWLVDEVGQATFADAGTPVPTPPIGSSVTRIPVTREEQLEGVPLVLGIALYDAPLGTPTVEPAIEPEDAFEPTHQSKSDATVSFRSGPSTESDIMFTLPPAAPLRWLGVEEIDEDGETWMQFEIVTGVAGWLRAVDVEPPSETVVSDNLCDPIAGTPVPCGQGYARFGPYWYTDLPAETDFTIRLHNAGSRPHRFVLEDLGIDVTVGPGGSAEFVLNAPAGAYLFLIYEGDADTPTGAGVFTVVSADQPIAVG